MNKPPPVECPDSDDMALAALTLLASAASEHNLSVERREEGVTLYINHPMRREEFGASVCIQRQLDGTMWFYWRDYSFPMCNASDIPQALSVIKRHLSVVLR